MSMIQLVYASRPFGFDKAMLSGILIDARRNNRRDEITGALICRADLYLQLLEGPQDKVEAAYERIERDDRHIEVTNLVHSTTDARLFGSWAMRSDPVQSWMWTPEQVEDGAPGRASAKDVIAVFSRLARQEPPGTGV